MSHTPAVVIRRADTICDTERIADAAVAQLRVDPGVAVASIAPEAGPGRMTLYSHFDPRRDQDRSGDR